MRSGKITKFVKAHAGLIMLIGILLIAAFFRLYHLNHLPPGLHPDEAANGLDIFRMQDHHDLRVLYATNGPREALFFYLQGIFVLLLGNTITALRIAPALIGLAAVYTTYLWAKSWFGERVALMSALLMAVSPWAVTITRDGFRASMTPLMVTLSMYLLTRAVQTKAKKWFIASGLVIGLGMYTYLAFRLFPLALIAVWICLKLWRKDFLKPIAGGLRIALITFAITLVPLALYGIRHPGDISGRVGGTSVLNSGLNHGGPVGALLTVTGKTALMFNIHGDDNYRHNLGGQPELNVFVGIMFILGIIICLSNLSRPRYYGLLFIFGAMLLPEVLTAEGIPHALRAIGALPEALILAALGIEYMLERWYATFPVNSAARNSGLAVILLLLFLSVYQGYQQYFVAWANSEQTYAAYSENAVAMGNYLLGHPFNGAKYVVIDGYSDKTVQYLTHAHTSYRRIDATDIASIPADGQPKLFLIVNSQHDASIKALKAHLPGGTLSPQYSTFNGAELFDTYTVTK